jgi:hypothetical protein
LDPSILDPEAAARPREALKSALAALDGETDLTQID